MTPPKHLTPGDFIQVPSEPFVYILNAKMGNRITFLIQPGRDDQDERTQVDELAATARFLSASKAMAERLVCLVNAYEYCRTHGGWADALRAESWEASKVLRLAGYTDDPEESKPLIPENHHRLA